MRVFASVIQLAIQIIPGFLLITEYIETYIEEKIFLSKDKLKIIGEYM